MRDEERRTPLANPTAERTSDQSSQSASGLSGGERRGPQEHNDTRSGGKPGEDVVARDNRGVDETPRRYDEDSEG